jgi:hypothetical protein
MMPSTVKDVSAMLRKKKVHIFIHFFQKIGKVSNLLGGYDTLPDPFGGFVKDFGLQLGGKL